MYPVSGYLVMIAKDLARELSATKCARMSDMARASGRMKRENAPERPQSGSEAIWEHSLITLPAPAPLDRVLEALARICEKHGFEMSYGTQAEPSLGDASAVVKVARPEEVPFEVMVFISGPDVAIRPIKS